MLTEMSVLDLSLNELSRRVGLAKSNVLRYFETREAILLELLSAEIADWAHSLDVAAVTIGADAKVRGDELAGALSTGLAARPLLCDLASAQAAVLERNVSTEVVLRHKLSIRKSVEEMARTIQHLLPELTREDALQIISIALLMTSAAWAHSRPTDALLAAYAAEPSLSELHLSFANYIRGTLEASIWGILARKTACTR